MGPLWCSLLEQLMPTRQVKRAAGSLLVWLQLAAGSMCLQELGTVAENPDAEPPHKPRISSVYAHGPVLVVLCPQHVPAERAVAWTLGVLQAFPAQRLCVMCSLPVRPATAVDTSVRQMRNIHISGLPLASAACCCWSFSWTTHRRLCMNVAMHISACPYGCLHSGSF